MIGLCGWPGVILAQCPSDMEQVDSYCSPVCVGQVDGCSGCSLPDYLDFDLEIYWGMQEAVILVGCGDDVTPAHAVIKDPDPCDLLTGPVLEDVYEGFSRKTEYYLQTVFDGSIFKVNGSTESPVAICSANDIEVTLINNDPETIRRARNSEILIKAQKYQQLTSAEAQPVHFTGALMSDRYRYWKSSEAFVNDEYSDIVEPGDYPNIRLAIPTAFAQSFDGIAIREGTRVIIYSGQNYTGDVLLDKNGPAIISAGEWQYIYGYVYENWSEPLNSEFPPAVREWVGNDWTPSWENGSMKILPAGSP